MPPINSFGSAGNGASGRPLLEPLDTLVVGAGPVGLLLASDLAGRGCKVRIIDLNEKPNMQTKASAVCAASMEVMPTLAANRILSNGHALTGAKFKEHKEGKPNTTTMRMSLICDGPGYCGVYAIKQHETEQFLAENLMTLPDLHRGGQSRMRVERGVMLESFVDKGDRVICQLRTTSGSTEEVVCKFLVACDGGKSTIRKSLGLKFDGTTTAEYFFALDARFKNGTWAKDQMEVIFATGGSHSLMPGWMFVVPFKDGSSLAIADLGTEQQAQWLTGETDAHGWPVMKQPEVEDCLKLLRMRGGGEELDIEPRSVKWLSHFRVQSRQAAHYTQGRVVLAGDACHCHSPAGGQGMNMGFQDAKNVAWKIALVAKGVSPPKLLLTYEDERRGLEKKLVKAIETATTVASSRSALFFFIRGRGQRLAAFLGLPGTTQLKYLTQQAWSYRKSSLVKEHWERPAVTLCPISSICPCGGYRRRQNLWRWVGHRVHAGDRAPDVLVEEEGDARLSTVLQRSRGFTLLLFEGLPSDNRDQCRHLRRVKTMDAQELQKFGEDLLQQEPVDGLVAGIDEVVIFPSNHEAHQAYGVHGQCLFLVRPDHHIGFRCEPMRAGAVRRYLRKTYGIKTGGSEQAPYSSPSFDWLPFLLYIIVFSCLGWLLYNHQDHIAYPIIVFILCVAICICHNKDSYAQ